MTILKTGGKFFAAGLVTVALAVTAQAKTLTFTDGSPNRGGRAIATNWLADELSKRTNGELKIEFHWGGALLKAKAATKGIGAGAADMGAIIGVYNPKLHVGYLMTDLPTKYSDPWVASRAVYELATTNKALIAEFDKLNLHYVTNFTTTEIQLICKGDAVKTIDDIKGIKVRGVGLYGKVFKDLGATPVRISAYKAYQGLDTGLINCSQTYSYFIPAVKMHEVAKEVTILNWGALNALTYAMNKDTWNALSDKNKKIVTQLGSDFIDKYVEVITIENDKALKDLAADKSITIHKFSAGDRQKLLDASEPYLADWKKKATAAGIDADAFHANYLSIQAKYDAERMSKGYPWKR
jgi:TRAP-type C4-dicarboxylate transport system substrate-binding protein